jgi:hypothetical protein
MADSKVMLQRFLDSMEMNFEKWHDGIGYDLEALDNMTPTDRDKVVDILLNFNSSNASRNFEALDHIKTSKASAAIKKALRHPSLEVRIAASRFAKGADSDRERVLIEALENSEIYGGLSQALDQIETFHPEGVIDALLRGLLARNSEAVNFAGMLFFIFGKAETSFDWNLRPFFLKFNTDNSMEREKAFIELCNTLGLDSKKYLLS